MIEDQEEEIISCGNSECNQYKKILLRKINILEKIILEKENHIENINESYNMLYNFLESINEKLKEK